MSKFLTKILTWINEKTTEYINKRQRDIEREINDCIEYLHEEVEELMLLAKAGKIDEFELADLQNVSEILQDVINDHTHE